MISKKKVIKQKRLSPLQKKIISFIQADIPCVHRPYADFAKDNDVPEIKVIEQIKILKEQGYIRRFGAILAHDRVGLQANCMCVWIVPENKIKKISGLAVEIPQISHCYLRKTSKQWPYNFYTMIHGKTKKQVQDIIDTLVEQTGAVQYRMLFTKKQFKKTSPLYSV